MANRQIGPIPRQLGDTLDAELHDFPGDATLRYRVRRLVEEAYATGYADGHFAGYREENADRRAAEQARRPAQPRRILRDEERDALTAALHTHLADTCPVWEETFAAGPGLVLGLPDAAIQGAKFLAEHAAERGLDG